MASKEKQPDNSMESWQESLETPGDRKLRIRSLYIVHLSMLVVSLGSSIIFTGVYPYLLSLDPNVSMIEYGLVVAADAAAQMIFAPIFGIIIDRIQTIRSVSLSCCTLFFLGNILYALVGAFNRENLFGASLNKTRVWVMLFSRFVVGAGTALNSAGRYYVSSATLITERTTHISLLSLFQTLGFICGPGIQAALTPLGPGDVLLSEGKVQFNMYTSTGYVSALTGLLCFILYLPGIFQEKYISNKELEAMKKMAAKSEMKSQVKAMVRRISTINTSPPDLQKSEAVEKPKNQVSRSGKVLREFSRISLVEPPMNIIEPKLDLDTASGETADKESEDKRPPMIPVCISIYNYFAFLCNFVLLETIMVKLAMDQWGWHADQAIQIMGFTIMGAGAMSVFVFAIIGPLSKRFDERLLLIVCGIIPMIVGRVVMFPIPGQPFPPIKQTIDCMDGQIFIPANNSCVDPGPTTTLAPDLFGAPYYLDAGTFAISGDQEYGCSYDWCAKIPRIEIPQFMVGFVVATAGYPFCLTLSGSIYSKVLGSANPGFWLGLFATSGSVARVVGPLLVTEIYELWGTYVLFIIVTSTLVISFVATLFAYRYMVPVHQINEDGKKADDSEAPVEKKEDKGKFEKKPIDKLPTFAEEEDEEEEEEEDTDGAEKKADDNKAEGDNHSFKPLVVYE